MLPAMPPPPSLPLPWADASGGARSWDCPCGGHEDERGIEFRTWCLLSWLVTAGVRPRALGADLVRHVFRERNSEADELAGKVSQKVRYNCGHFDQYFRLKFDAADAMSTSIGGTGWLLEGARVRSSERGAMRESSTDWEKVAHGCGELAVLTSSTHAKLHAL